MGFMASWQLGEFEDLAYRTSILNGAVEVGDVGTRLLGLAWLVAGAAVVVAAVALWQARPSALRANAAAAAISLVVCLAGLRTGASTL